MNPARKTPRVTETNPGSVLRSISSNNGFDLSQSSFDPAESSMIADAYIETTPQSVAAVEVHDLELDSQAIVRSDVNRDANEAVISLRINPDTTPNDVTPPENVLESTIESACQIQQLAARLEANEQELQNRELELEQRIEAWTQATSLHQTEFQKQLSQVGQQAAQVRCQQRNLMQLQTDIVKSHRATQAAIESLVHDPGSDERTTATLKALKYEISGRFDFIARRWEHLAELLQKTRMQIDSDQAIDDSIDWSGDLS